jgi:phosphohistidine swiveling domain-containing protein
VTGIDPVVRGSSGATTLWTLKGIPSEQAPGLHSPLCWSVWREPVELGLRRNFADFGVISPRDVYFPNNPDREVLGVFYGRRALNIDESRRLFGRVPGSSANEFERALLGTVRDGVDEVQVDLHRRLTVLIKAPRKLRRITTGVQQTYEATLAWWRADVLRGRPTPAGGPIALFDEALRRWGRTLSMQIGLRYAMQSSQGVLLRAATKLGSPELAAKLSAGLGDVHDTRMADDLWRLSREEIDVETFLESYGYHGPNEGNVLTHSWREQPHRVEGLAAAYANRADLVRPLDRAALATDARFQAERELVSRAPAPARPAVRWLLARTGSVVYHLQLGRLAYLMCLDGIRAGARLIGRDAVNAGTLADAEDVFMLTVSEVRDLVAGRLPDAEQIVASRRADRAEYAMVDIPETFTGPPVPTPRAAPVDGVSQIQNPSSAVKVTGIGASGGRVRGRAHVVIDTDLDFDIGEGGILVSRITDPSWMPLISLAEALVIDIGGPASHGAIVARELGIACVIGTGNGTAVIRDGDEIIVDGDAGTVEVVANSEAS